MKDVQRKVHIVELVSAIIIVLTSVFLLLTGLNVFLFSIGSCALIAVFACLTLISLITAIVLSNSIAFSFSWIFGMLLVAQIFIALGLTVRNIYPIYVIALPLGIANGAVKAKLPSAVIKVAFAFIGVGLILLLESCCVLSVQVVLPIIAIFIGLILMLYALSRLISKDGRNEK